jgi:hypothetical protein
MADVAPCPAVWVAFADVRDKDTAFRGWFNKVAARVTGGNYAHCSLIFKLNESNATGFHASILWGERAFCQPETFSVDGNGVVRTTAPSILDGMRAIAVAIPMEWDPAAMMEAADALVGYDYDRVGAVLCAGPDMLARSRDLSVSKAHRVFCSEMVAYLLHTCCSVSLAPHASPECISPNDLAALLKK